MAPCRRSAKCMMLTTAAAGSLFLADQVRQLGRLRKHSNQAHEVAEATRPAAPPAPRARDRAVAAGAAVAAEAQRNPAKPSFAEPEDVGEDIESSAECKDVPGYNQTCLLRNAYWNPEWGMLHLHVLEGRSLPFMRINNWGGPLAGGSPVGERFPSQEALRQRARQLKPVRRRGLALSFQALWHHNWAHATWDGLYPAFVALAKFGLHAERFLPFVLTPFEAPANCSDLRNMMCAMEEAYRLFGSLGDPYGELLRVHDAMNASRWILFERLLVGSGQMGQLTAVLNLPATREFKYLPPDRPLLPLFVSRLFAAHGLAAPARRRRSDEARPLDKKLKAVIIHNRRFDPELVAVLRASAEACTARCSGLEVSYLNWTTVQPFSRQLQLLRETDIHVSSIGTALYTSLLLPDGSVSVNLGVSDHPWHAGLPSYGEEFLATSHQGVRTLYMPLDRLRSGPGVDDVVTLLEQAGQAIRGGFAVPTGGMEENLSIFGKIILNLTLSSEASRLGLEGWRRMEASAPSEEPNAELLLGDGSRLEYSTEDQTKCVPLRGHMSPLVLESAPGVESCRVDVGLLRSLKRDFGLREALGAAEGCECEVCQACGAGR